MSTVDRTFMLSGATVQKIAAYGVLSKCRTGHCGSRFVGIIVQVQENIMEVMCKVF